MKKINWISLLFAILGTACLAGIGISVAERSIFGILACILVLLFIMGFGFTRKKKLRESGIL